MGLVWDSGFFRACAFLANPPPPPPDKSRLHLHQKTRFFRFFLTPRVFQCFFANVNACSNLAGYYLGFWSRGTWPSAESPDRGPRRNAHYTCAVQGREKSRMRTTYQNTSMRFGFFSRMRFSCQKPWMIMGFSGSVNLRFLDFGFCQCKWALWDSDYFFRACAFLAKKTRKSYGFFIGEKCH